MTQKPIVEYINELNSLILFKLVDTLELTEVDRVNTFLSKPIAPQNALVHSRK